MQEIQEAVKDYFHRRNQMWVSGEPLSISDRTCPESEHDWRKSATEEYNGVSRLLRFLHSRILRAHTKIHLQTKLDTNSAAQVFARVAEQVTWVYRDGAEYRVESRLYQHHQTWLRKQNAWCLAQSKMLLGEVNGPDDDMSDRGRSPLQVQAHLRKTRSCLGYDRLQVLRYADLWWDGFNPMFRKFEVDCTNYVSQCLLAGGLPMQKTDTKESGWWYSFGTVRSQDRYSYSWSTSNALYIYLKNEVSATRMDDAKDLKIGDVIFYDWDGTGIYHHSTVVTDFDGRGEPLVNAHTDASFHRHYSYLDSRAWTPRTRYKFVHVPDTFC